MIPLADDQGYFAVTHKERNGLILSFGLFFASFAILSSPAEAMQCGQPPAKLSGDQVSGSGPNPRINDDNARLPDGGAVQCGTEKQAGSAQRSQAALPNRPAADATIQPPERKHQRSRPADFNREIYYRNKLEFSLDGGWFPINVPFPFNILEGDPYNLYPLRYTLVPIIASLRWHLGGVGGPPILRGNWDVTFSGSYTAIPRGAETRYFSYDMEIRRNFVPRNWHAAPYWDIRLGLGNIDAKGPLGVYYAQGQNFTFNMNMGSGVRYNLNSRYAISAGLNWMHISNANLSSPHYSNYGINVYGPIFGIDVGLRRHSRPSEQ